MNRMNRNGQAMSEMLFIAPLLLAIIGGSLFVVYGAWQGIRVQQAANLGARIQGEERIAGGSSAPKIEEENGNGLGAGDPDPDNSANLPGVKFTQTPSRVPNTSVYGKFYNLIKDEFFPTFKSQVYVPPPQIGQNIDEVKVVRIINLPKIPFFNWGKGEEQLRLEGTAWGGEDTYAYGLPRWGRVGNNGDAEWRQRLIADKNQPHD
jgi:hypothetical protein